MTDLDWCIKVYDTVDHISTPEDAQDQPNLKAIWSKIDDRMPNVFKRLIPIRFVGAAPADSKSDKSVPLAGMMTSPRCDRVAAALRSFPSPPAPPPTPVAMERPKSPSLDQKVRMRSFARETARADNIFEQPEPTFIEELKASIRDLVRDGITKLYVANSFSLSDLFHRIIVPQISKKNWTSRPLRSLARVRDQIRTTTRSMEIPNWKRNSRTSRRL